MVWQSAAPAFRTWKLPSWKAVLKSPVAIRKYHLTPKWQQYPPGSLFLKSSLTLADFMENKVQKWLVFAFFWDLLADVIVWMYQVVWTTLGGRRESHSLENHHAKGILERKIDLGSVLEGTSPHSLETSYKGGGEKWLSSSCYLFVKFIYRNLTKVAVLLFWFPNWTASKGLHQLSWDFLVVIHPNPY